MLSLSTRLRPRVPVPVPVLAVTAYVAPLPDTPVIAGDPPRPVFASEKSDASTPVTLSLNVTTHPTVAAFVGLEDARTIETIVGEMASMTSILLAASDPAAPGAGSVNVALFGLFGTVSLIVPPFNESADVET